MTIDEPIRAQYSRLVGALTEGWWVEPPIYTRPAWSAQAGTRVTYHFVLRRAEELTLMSVDDNPVVRDLMARHGWMSSGVVGASATEGETALHD